MAFICFNYYSIVTVVENGEVQLSKWVGSDKTRDLRRSGTQIETGRDAICR